ncbi:MAG TPA: phage terminase small subunit P27 family [Actinomycetota bacterium]|nr:phage terminase small subunit P27 family [Actinomycetota bacterium]
MKGRPRDPTRARRQTGHRRKPSQPAIVRALPAPKVDTLGPPEDLPKELVPVWTNLVDALGGVTSLRPADAFAVEAMVRQFARIKQAGELVDQYGMVTQTVSGDVTVSPFLKAERDATAMFLRLAEHYGLTVAARLRLGLMQLAGKTLAQQLAEDLEG